VQAGVSLSSVTGFKPDATRIVLVGERGAQNTFENPLAVAPRAAPFTVSDSFMCGLPANSFSVIRMKTK
jgi:hypothetical protein